MRHTTLKQLRCLSAVIRTGSVTAAAAELHVTPPAVTAQIRSLEEQVASPLIERCADRFRATEAGEEVANSLRRIEAVLAECADALEVLKRPGHGRISIGIVGAAKYFAPMALAAFYRDFPKAQIRLSVGNRYEIVRALHDYDLDLAVMGTPPHDFPVHAHVIGSHPLVMIAHPDHPLAARTAIQADELRGEMFLVREQGSGTRAAFDAFMSDPCSGDVRRDIEFGSNETIKQAVMAGLGIAFISAHTIAAEVESRRLKILDVVNLPVMRQWYVVCRTDKRLLAAAESLRSFWLERGSAFLPRVALPE